MIEMSYPRNFMLRRNTSPSLFVKLEEPKVLKRKSMGRLLQYFDCRSLRKSHPVPLFSPRHSKGFDGPSWEAAVSKQTWGSTDDDIIWVIKFNHDGEYIVVGGKSGKISVWKTKLVCRESTSPLFVKVPLHIWKGHTEAVVDISWSLKNFVVSASLDFVRFFYYYIHLNNIHRVYAFGMYILWNV